jgi:hypothetical protein
MKYIYGGTPANIGRFGQVATGQILDLAWQEAAVVAGDSDYALLPTKTQQELKVTTDTTLSTDDAGKKIVCNHAEAATLTLPAVPDVGDAYQVFMGSGTADVTFDPGDNAIALWDVASAVVPKPGVGYNVADTVTLAGGTNTTAGVLAVATIGVVTAAVQAAGTGYHVNDVLTVAGGTGTAATVKVTTIGGTGNVTGVSILTAGSYTVKPANPASTTGGYSGSSGAKLTLSWGILTVTVQTNGSYTVEMPNPVAQASSSGPGTGASFTVTWEALTAVLKAAADSVGLYWDGAYWQIF